MHTSSKYKSDSSFVEENLSDKQAQFFLTS
jgi:hypothetical protein